jgi:hypothetical protein
MPGVYRYPRDRKLKPEQAQKVPIVQKAPSVQKILISIAENIPAFIPCIPIVMNTSIYTMGMTRGFALIEMKKRGKYVNYVRGPV